MGMIFSENRFHTGSRPVRHFSDHALGEVILGSIGRFVIASQRVRPDVAGPMTSSAKQSRSQQKKWIASSLSLLAMTTQ
jgi:hypothetical protein